MKAGQRVAEMSTDGKNDAGSNRSSCKPDNQQAQDEDKGASDDGGMAYSTDDSGDRQSKLARRQKLRRKIMEWFGCTYDDAKLMLAEADTGRLVEGTYRFRGDAWRLDQACDLWTSRATALKAEQRAKWTVEVKLASGCDQQMAFLAVSVAEGEPSLIRNGKLEVARLVKWAVEWVEERRWNRRTADSYYEESAVQMLQKDKAAKERAQRSMAAPAAPLSAGPPKPEFGLSQPAMMVLMRNDSNVREDFPPLEADSELAKELVSELQHEVKNAYGAAAELGVAQAYLALKASRYDGPASGHGWPTVEGAMKCLRARKRPQVDAAKGEQVERGAGAAQTRSEELLLTREALCILGRVEQGELKRRPEMDKREGKLDALVQELGDLAGKMHGDAVAKLTRLRAIHALDAGRYLPGVESDKPSVATALRCLQRCGHKELWQTEVEQISQQTGMDLTDAWGARGRAMRADPSTTDVVALAVEMEAKRRAAESIQGAMGCQSGQWSKNRRTPSDSDIEESRKGARARVYCK
jgi:hypothetical protein